MLNLQLIHKLNSGLNINLAYKYMTRMNAFNIFFRNLLQTEIETIVMKVELIGFFPRWVHAILNSAQESPRYPFQSRFD